MKRTALGLVLALLAVLAGCGATPGAAHTPSSAPTSVLGLGPAPWTSGEIDTYDVLTEAGANVGTSIIAITSAGNTWIISETDHIQDLDQSWRITIDATTLKPLGEEKAIQTPGTTAVITTTYTSGKLQVDAVVNGQGKNATLNVPANSIDNDQLLITLRALPFAAGYQAQYMTIVAQNALQIPTTVRVQDKESVTVPAGAFETWKVELDFGQGKQYAWYEVASPRRLIKYDNGASRLELVK